MAEPRACEGPRSPVIPPVGRLRGTLSRFMASQPIFSRLNPGPDVPVVIPSGEPTV